MSARKTFSSSLSSSSAKAAAKATRGKSMAASRDDSADLLHSAHLRVTPARTAVLDALRRAGRLLSHADLESLLPQQLDRVTLYRTLESFVDTGLAARMVGADRVGRFAFVDNAAAHHEHAHFLCDDCGRTVCLPIPVPRPPSLPKGFAVTSADLSFHGHCADCQSDEKGPRDARGRGRA